MAKKEIQMKTFNTVEVLGRTHVVKPIDRPKQIIRDGIIKIEIPEPNYRRTGMALCGVTRPGESLQDWIKRTQP